ncbi:MAG: muramoyltetrapeptide carboxypeptidase [Tenuifilum sp.]|jgi:muramoyltetrapeptide carboxypeptidase|uniref:S66 peptidase family protein n=1 Tax=Tenuifilum sp. TaxID=2760880 RepID=UPI0024AA89F2|nr:LD-carboxypeptidase [Tenuifilum sp.]MDI3526236.1 muramoyltetrapeptide carboxypeptidase [Tenuifilum sp.]
MENITPPYLQPGDTIGIVAPARFVSREMLQPAIRFLTNQGYLVKTAPHLYSRHYQFAGTDGERAQDLMEMIEDPSVKAILCARGGYGTVRILDLLNLRKLQQNPKWIIGYSDITVLHSLINGWFGIESLHATMPINFPESISGNESTLALVKALTGEPLSYTLPNHPLNLPGRANGMLIGGNLSMLSSLCGTTSDMSYNGRILFIEDVDEYLYHIDRMVMQLKRSGKLKSITGLIIGHFTEMKDNEIPFGSNAYEIIYSAVKEYNIPVCFGFPAGHSEPNLPLILGRNVNLVVDEKEVKISFTNTL